jgi:hypothetical protein
MITLDLASPSALTCDPGLTGTVVKALLPCEITVNAGHVSNITLGKDYNYHVVKGPLGLELLSTPAA